MFSRFGLRARMAVSYVLVSAAAVVLVEAVLLAVMVPQMRAASARVAQAQQAQVEAEDNSAQIKVDDLSREVATAAGDAVSATAAQSPGVSDEQLLGGAAGAAFGGRDQWQPPDSSKAPTTSAHLLATVDGRVIAGDVRGYPRLPPEAVGTSARSGQTTMNGQPAHWATKPVFITNETKADRRVVGIAYVMLAASNAGDKKPVAPAVSLGPLVLPGAIVLILLLPVGALFGLLSTGRLIRRIRRLAEGASAMADGDLAARIPVSGGDEAGRLEQAFNTMAERLDAAVRVERKAAGSAARRAERARIARELHDSISQDLFSASMVAGGLRKALPATSDLRRQAESMEQSLARTMREMRAMLLELRPIALEDAGLAEALGELCRTYQERAGIPISARIDPLRLDAAIEHAVLRVVQEAVSNAVRHGEPATIALRVAMTDGRVSVAVQDDGRGFDPLHTAGRHGMGLALMRERVGELGGTVEVRSAPNCGTTVTVWLPGGTG
jgi:signal transduction histidine kinase